MSRLKVELTDNDIIPEEMSENMSNTDRGYDDDVKKQSYKQDEGE